MISVSKKQWFYFTTHWPEYLLLLWWLVFPRSRGSTLPHIGLNTCSSSDDECIQEAAVLLYHTLAWILAPGVMMSVSKKQRIHFTTYWPEYLLLLCWEPQAPISMDHPLCLLLRNLAADLVEFSSQDNGEKRLEEVSWVLTEQIKAGSREVYLGVSVYKYLQK